MKILVLGGGVIGSSVADVLCEQRHRVTIVEKNHDLAAQIDSEMDVKVIVGSASESSILFQAGVTSTNSLPGNTLQATVLREGCVYLPNAKRNCNKITFTTIFFQRGTHGKTEHAEFRFFPSFRVFRVKKPIRVVWLLG